VDRSVQAVDDGADSSSGSSAGGGGYRRKRRLYKPSTEPENMRELYKTLERYTEERTRDNERKVVAVEDLKARDAKWFSGRIKIHKLFIVVLVAYGLSQTIGWVVTHLDKANKYDDLMADKLKKDNEAQAHLDTIAERDVELDNKQEECDEQLAEA